jgi:uncharacterized membrane protein
MAEADGIMVFVAVYSNVEDAKEDFESLKLLHKEKFVGDYESALFEKREDGKVKILNTDATERTWGAKVGTVTGAVIGLIFPPTIVGMAVAGAGVGAVAGNFMKGMKRKDIAAMGEMLDEGQAGVVLVGETTIAEGVERAMKKAAKIMKQQVDADAAAIKKAIDEAVE